MLLENEQNTTDVFDANVSSVVSVTNIKIVKRHNWFDFDVMKIPRGAGTGFVWDKNGHIITNYHVIAGGDSFLISFRGDKKQYKAKVVGGEPKKDIAVLKLVELPQKLHPIKKIGDSSLLKVGQKAVAIGNPFGLVHSVTEGIVSALERKIEGFGGVKIHGMIQTDCSINQGNSGGPLLNSRGEVIGVNAMIYSPSGSSAGVGFAVPINTVKRIVPQLIKYGKIKRPGMGIGLLGDHMGVLVRERFGIKKGIIIRSVFPGGPARKAGLVGMGQDRTGRYYLGDVILMVAGKEVNTYDDIYHALDGKKVGDKVEVKFLREGKTRKVRMKLAEISPN